MNFRVQILGSSSALPSYKHFPSAQIVTVHDEPFLIDCGEGTQIQLRRFNTKFGKIKNIFISHLHGDHFFGLFGLISSYNLTGRTQDLNIYSDQNLELIFKTQYPLVNISELKFNLIFHHLPMNQKVIFENKNLQIESFPLKHSISTWGFIFKEKKRSPNIRKEKINELSLTIEQILTLKDSKDLIIDDKIYKNSDLTIQSPEPRRYAFCSDTSYNEAIIEIIKKADLLYHEATFLSSDKQTAEATGHSTAAQATLIAQKANVKSLIIGHFSTRYKSLKPYLSEARKIFDKTILAEDGMIAEIDIEHNLRVFE